ncbi:GAF domain-containing protein [Sphingomonas koreensis]|nr:GAF domain-containing protein [Sphingomonas koreensis]
MDDLVRSAVASADDDAIREILAELCAITDMGFAAVARVTDARWIACQVLDKIEFGLDPGDELDLKTTICNDIRQSGSAVVIDHVADHPDWRTHHTPVLYGFESYASFPIVLADGSFFGTLCAIDPAPRSLTSADTIAAMQSLAKRAAAILSMRR